jgi:hypothetical protein
MFISTDSYLQAHTLIGLFSFNLLLLLTLIFCTYEGWSKISRTEFIVGKQKHLQVTRCYLLQSTTLQIVCSDSSDPSTFQRMPGRIVWEWPTTAVSCLVVSPQRLKIVSSSGCSSAWGRGRSHRGPNLVSKAGGEPHGCCAWPRIPWHSGLHDIVMVQKPGTGRPFVRPFLTNCISKALQNRVWFMVWHWGRNSWCTRPSAPKKAISTVLTFDRTCLAFSMSQMSWTDSTLFLWMLVVAFHMFLWPSYQVSGRTWCKQNTLLLQHLHFTIWRRDKHKCTADQLTHNWVKLPPAPLVCGDVSKYPTLFSLWY